MQNYIYFKYEKFEALISQYQRNISSTKKSIMLYIDINFH